MQVYYHPNTKEAVIIHRGSKSLKDWLINYPAYALNNFENTERYIHAKDI